jgi:DNA-binding NtrC family response regulator
VEDFQHLHQHLDETKKPELKILQKDSEKIKEAENKISGVNSSLRNEDENEKMGDKRLFSFTMQSSDDGALDLKINFPDQGLNLKDIVTRLEDSLILESLKRTNGNKNQASKLLGLNRTTLIEKMKKKKMSLEYNLVVQSPAQDQ